MRKRSLAIQKLSNLRQNEGVHQCKSINKNLSSRENILRKIKQKREELNLIYLVSLKIASSLNNEKILLYIFQAVKIINQQDNMTKRHFRVFRINFKTKKRNKH